MRRFESVVFIEIRIKRRIFYILLRNCAINNPDASIGVCCSHKVIALGFNTLCYDAERRGIKPSARIKFPLQILNHIR